MANPFTADAQLIPRWQDPRPDLEGDHVLWVDLLSRLFKSDRKLWDIFYGLRCGGAYLTFSHGEAIVNLSPEWDLPFKTKIRRKYLHHREAAMRNALQTIQQSTELTDATPTAIESGDPGSTIPAVLERPEGV